jgi:transcriptional regulator with XRE-family HTH domain
MRNSVKSQNMQPKVRKVTKDEIVQMLRTEQAERTNRDFAAELGIHESYLSDIYNNRREPGPAVLDKLNITKKVVYELAA